MTIAQLQPQGSGSLFLDSVRQKDREEILGGTVAITKYQGKGFELDLPTIFRLLRDKFRPKDR